MKNKKVKEKRLVIKMLICLIYLIIITILFVCSYKLYEEKKNVLPWSNVESVEDYTYINVSKMSEKFAYYEKTNIGIHFVIEKEETGMWHTYLIAINEKDYKKYKKIIDYTYERTEKVPKPIKVYGYPVMVDKELKDLAISNIPNFIPEDNEIKITAENYEEYLTNCYLDTTKNRTDDIDIILYTSLGLLVIIIVLFILTIFDKDKIVTNIDEKIDEEIAKTKKLLKIQDK